jgi:hypothetical protein
MLLNKSYWLQCYNDAVFNVGSNASFNAGSDTVSTTQILAQNPCSNAVCCTVSNAIFNADHRADSNAVSSTVTNAIFNAGHQADSNAVSSTASNAVFNAGHQADSIPSPLLLQMPSSMLPIKQTPFRLHYCFKCRLQCWPSSRLHSVSITASNAVFNAGHQADSIPSPLLLQLPSSMLAIKLTPMPSQSIASNAVFNAGYHADSKYAVLIKCCFQCLFQ